MLGSSSRRRPFGPVTTAFVCLALLGAHAVACGDSNDKRKFSNVSPTTTTTTSGTGGSGGAGGADALNICACMEFALNENGPDSFCFDCRIDAVKNGEPCDAAQQSCNSDPECTALIVCVGACEVDGVADLDCLGGCMYPIDKNAGSQKYNDWVVCSCALCAAECDSYGSTVCEPGVGGAGGAGGSGGSGGSGGAGGG